jgi:DNA-binding response OmpR family regulator
LVADNDPDTLHIRAEYLESLGYRVSRASSYEEAQQLLSETWLHLALLDLRLTDDTDDRDQSGLLLAKDEDFRATPMIILTKHPTWEVTREALGPSKEGTPLAVDFIDKREGLEAMAQAVDHAFDTYVRINNDLVFHFDEHFLLSWPALARVAAPHVADPRLVADRSEEMEDLWRRLFYEMEEVHLTRLLLRREHCVTLHVLAFPGRGSAQELIVIVGPRENVVQEVQRHDQFSPTDAGQRGLRQAYFAETHAFASIAYAPSGGVLGHTELLVDRYCAASAGVVCQVVDDLFGESLLPWHQQPRAQEDRSLNELYRVRLGFGHGREDRRLLEESVEVLCEQALSVGLPCAEATRYRLSFHLSDTEQLELPHPAVFVFPEKEQAEIGPPTLCSVNLGAVRCDRILVDSRDQQTWLLDFSQISSSPALDDYVSLEASILFDLAVATDLAAQRQLVETLLESSSGLGDRPEPPGDLATGLRKAVRVIDHLRRRAAKTPGSNLEAYHLGVLFQGAHRLLAFHKGRRYPCQRLGAGLRVLLCTGLIGQWLEGASTQMPPSLPQEAKTGLWVDEGSRRVWVEGRQVSLSRKLYELLMLLYRRGGQVCDRATIAREVFKVEFFDPLMEETRINPLIGRLRKQVEPDPSRPRYILTHHGVGYVLYPQGQDDNG